MAGAHRSWCFPLCRMADLVPVRLVVFAALVGRLQQLVPFVLGPESPQALLDGK